MIHNHVLAASGTRSSRGAATVTTNTCSCRRSGVSTRRPQEGGVAAGIGRGMTGVTRCRGNNVGYDGILCHHASEPHSIIMAGCTRRAAYQSVTGRSHGPCCRKAPGAGTGGGVARLARNTCNRDMEGWG